MAIKKFNFNVDGNLVTDEEIVLVGGNKVYTFAHHNVMSSKGITIRTGKGATGTAITDFSVVNNSSKEWVQEIRFGNSVGNGTYYVKYYSEGDENDADDINGLNVAVEKAVKNQERLIARYVHSGNKVIKPISVDLATGVFTSAEPILLPVGTTRAVITSYPTEPPPRLFAEWNGSNSYSVKVLSSTTFTMTTGGALVTYASSANNLGVDVRKIQFEYDSTSPRIDLTGLQVGDELRVVATGVRDRLGWSYAPPKFTHDGTAFPPQDLLGVDGRDFIIMYSEKSYKYFREMGMYIAHGGKSITKNWRGGTGWDIAFSQDNNREFHYFENLKFTSVDVMFNMANNFVIEVYTTIKEV